MDPLARIKRWVLRRSVLFTEKALIEMATDDLSRTEVIESLLNA